MKKSYLIFFLLFPLVVSFTNNLFSQGYTAQLVLDTNLNTLTVVMTSSVGGPLMGVTISSLSMTLIDGGGMPVTGLTLNSSNYGFSAPLANGSIGISGALASPDDWSSGGPIIVAVYNVPGGSTIADYQIQLADVGPPDEDPFMSAGFPAGFSQNIFVQSTILPVELISYTAKNKKTHIALDWATASEINNDRFIIERSADGVEFVSIATVDGAGTSSQVLEYTYNDLTPINGKNYYRLVNVDFDETHHYNEIRSVEFGGNSIESASISIYPNPVTNSFSVVSAGDIQGQTLRLMDLQGRVISEVTYRDGMIVDMDDMAAGIYRVMILSVSNETVHVQQVLKTD